MICGQDRLSSQWSGEIAGYNACSVTLPRGVMELSDGVGVNPDCEPPGSAAYFVVECLFSVMDARPSLASMRFPDICRQLLSLATYYAGPAII
ncbi:hypothetical protein X797_008726 [Metarhizium robertsii]|uniref:Uncharacterized protein n=1 Tax=Metarhizium robertsii TaxID=568076 RepID=A0A0A1UR78_9HYPO|nr:hypothetical protein X797_008726 [Metarhizium robertsii]